MKTLVKGWPASPGRVTGHARIILSSNKMGELRPGEILVAKITDAAMFVDIINNASAIVTDLGGTNSHPAIVARELGIPCVVATKKATKVITNGTKILVDGEKGVVYESD